MDIKDLKNLEDGLEPIWLKKGMSAEEYVKDLTERLEQVNDVINGRRNDFSIVKSTIKDTIEFIAWANAKKELSTAVSLIRANLMKAKVYNYGKLNNGRAEGIDEGE